MGTLREAADAAMEIASKIFDKQGNVSPIWLIEKPDGNAVVHAQFTGDDSKDTMVALIKQKFGATATRIIFIAEAWMRRMQGPPDGIRPSQAPDRIEAIHLLAEDRTGGQISMQRIIDRSSGTAKLLPPEVHKLDIIGGRFASFFDRTTERKH